ncbi:MAG: hypothetical protein ACTHKE_04360 [Sphingomicrobium sp.]
MPTPKQPQDHKAKAAEVSECFSFEHKGETYTFKNTIEHITPGFLRKNRKLNDLDAFFTILETLADEEQLEVIDSLTHEEFGQLNRDFYEHLGAQRGE